MGRENILKSSGFYTERENEKKKGKNEELQIIYTLMLTPPMTVSNV